MYIELALIVIVVSSLFTYLLMKILINILKRNGWVVEDAHKPNRPLIPRPAGPALIVSILIGEGILYYATRDIRLLALSFTLLLAGIIGFIDDVKHLKGYYKPILLILAALPIILLGAYVPQPLFPIYGKSVRLFIVYPLLILIAIPVTANTINTIDVFNGVVSGFTLIATIPLMVAFALRGDWIIFTAALPFIASTSIFYLYHRNPSKIFPGDSGTLALGALYGALAICGRAEVVGVIALLPAILNSFFFLSSVRRIIEHREVKERPIKVLPDFRLAPSQSKDAPITLTRLILAKGPLNETEVTRAILTLTGVAAILAVATALLTWW
ncbi:MAG: UDP-N-acetylglucosamine-1-phosphate transferase [Nitrososphaerales archaeon]